MVRKIVLFVAMCLAAPAWAEPKVVEYERIESCAPWSKDGTQVFEGIWRDGVCFQKPSVILRVTDFVFEIVCSPETFTCVKDSPEQHNDIVERGGNRIAVRNDILAARVLGVGDEEIGRAALFYLVVRPTIADDNERTRKRRRRDSAHLPSRLGGRARRVDATGNTRVVETECIGKNELARYPENIGDRPDDVIESSRYYRDRTAACHKEIRVYAEGRRDVLDDARGDLFDSGTSGCDECDAARERFVEWYRALHAKRCDALHFGEHGIGTRASA